jgi:hypothetical protein
MSAGESTRYWFPAKRYGWGWGPPATWQGWAVLAVYLIAVVLGAPALRGHRLLQFLWIAALTVLLIGVCWWQGEPPRWRWDE